MRRVEGLGRQIADQLRAQGRQRTKLDGLLDLREFRASRLRLQRPLQKSGIRVDRIRAGSVKLQPDLLLGRAGVLGRLGNR